MGAPVAGEILGSTTLACSAGTTQTLHKPCPSSVCKGSRGMAACRSQKGSVKVKQFSASSQDLELVRRLQASRGWLF